MGLDAKLRKLSSRMMQKFGTSATIRRVTAGTYDTTTGTQNSATMDTVVKGRLEDVFNSELSSQILSGDKRFLFAAADLTFIPTPGDRVLVLGLLYGIVRVRQLMAIDEPALIELVLRK